MKTNPNQKLFYAMLMGIVLYISFAALTDVVGTSKVTWVVSQLFAIILISLSSDSKHSEIELKYINTK